MTTREAVIECLIDVFKIWDDMAEEMVQSHGDLIAEEVEDIPALAQRIVEEECKKLGVEELPADYLYAENNGDDGDEDDERSWE